MNRKVLPWMFMIASCEGPAGPQGPAGDPGEQGDAGAAGDDGDDGDTGPSGLACWDLNGNGTADAAEDVDDNGVWDAVDCAGVAGSPGELGDAGDPGINCWDLDGDRTDDPEEDTNGDTAWNALDCVGAQGDDGDQGDQGDPGDPGTPCWDLDNDGTEDPDEDENGDGLWNASDCAGVSTGTLTGVVVDAATGALVEDATVTAEPLGLETTTGADGTFLFEDAPFGVYTVSVTAPSLVLEDDVVVESLDTTAESSASLLAGETAYFVFALDRLDLETTNLTDAHDGDEAVFVNANCEACHSNREAETSTDASESPFHAMTTHAGLSCTYCHADSIGVDVGNETGWHNESAAALRKQVDISTCTTCHLCYPDSFCALAGCAGVCP